MKGNALLRCLCAFGVAVAIIVLAHYVENDFKAKKKISEVQKLKSSQNVKTKKKKQKKPVFDSKADWEKHTVTIYWRPAKNASKYRLVCYATEEGGSEIKTEQDISATKEPSYTHKIAYGAKYEYEIRIYRILSGKEYWVTTKCYDVDAIAPRLKWADGTEKTTEYAKLCFYKYTEEMSPTGIEIYRGENKKQMKLVDTVMWDELPDYYNKYNVSKQYIDKGNSYADYYQIRSFVDVDGKRHYGKKSKIRGIFAEGYRGEVKARLKMDFEKLNIKKMEVIIKNTGKKPIKVGMPYIKNYYKEGKFKKEYVFLLYFATSPIYSSNDLKIDKIEYKSHASKKYKILSKDATVVIKPGEKMSFRFSRKNGQKFRNYFLYEDNIPGEWSDGMNLYLFQYMGKKVFIHILVQEKDGEKVFYSTMKKDESGEPYTYDLQDD